MKNLKPKILALLVTILFFSCNDSETILEPVTEDQLPPITQAGRNTFGCLINGNIFIPKDKTGYTPPGGGTPKGIEIYGSNSAFVIQAKNYINTSIYIYPRRFTK